MRRRSPLAWAPDRWRAPCSPRRPAPPAAPPTAGPPTATPIKHFIVLMQENHSFDNYFGTYPGADGIPTGICMPVDTGDRRRAAA